MDNPGGAIYQIFYAWETLEVWSGYVRSGHVRLYQLRHGWSDWLVILNSWVVSNHIDYYMMSLSGQVRSGNGKFYQS